MLRRPRLPPTIILPGCRRRSWPVAACVLVIALVAAFERGRSRPVSNRSADAFAAQPFEDVARYHDRIFRVARVVDGDTIDIDARDGDAVLTRIRLWGVDAPEQVRAGGQATYFGTEATEFARRQLEGRDVYVLLSPNRTRDKYGRLLAYVTLERGGPMFNETLVEQGYALADRRFPHHYSRRFEAAEKQAKKSGLGLWAGGQPEDLPDWYHNTALTRRP